jgi:Protein of unknown function (DUF2783)
MKGELLLEPNISDPDEFYAELLALHEGRSKAESDAINARLILILANHVGDLSILRQAMETAARATGKATRDEGGSNPGK